MKIKTNEKRLCSLWYSYETNTSGRSSTCRRLSERRGRSASRRPARSRAMPLVAVWKEKAELMILGGGFSSAVNGWEQSEGSRSRKFKGLEGHQEQSDECLSHNLRMEVTTHGKFRLLPCYPLTRMTFRSQIAAPRYHGAHMTREYLDAHHPGHEPPPNGASTQERKRRKEMSSCWHLPIWSIHGNKIVVKLDLIFESWWK